MSPKSGSACVWVNADKTGVRLLLLFLFCQLGVEADDSSWTFNASSPAWSAWNDTCERKSSFRFPIEAVPGINVLLKKTPESNPAAFSSRLRCVCDGRPLMWAQCFGNSSTQLQSFKIWSNQNCNFDSQAANASAIQTLFLEFYQDWGGRDLQNNFQLGIWRSYILMKLSDHVSGGNLDLNDTIYLSSLLHMLVPDREQIILDYKTSQDFFAIGSATLNSFDPNQECFYLGNSVIHSQEFVLSNTTNKTYSNPRRYFTETMAMEIWDLGLLADDELIVGLVLKESETSSFPVLNTTTVAPIFEFQDPNFSKAVAGVYLSWDFLKKFIQEKGKEHLRLVLAVYINTTMFESGKLETLGKKANGTYNLDSVVISATLFANGEPITDVGDDGVTLAFHPFTKSSGTKGKHLCVFWNTSGDGGRGAWSEEGCALNGTQDGREICVCDHLTNFALILETGDNRDPRVHGEILSVISKVGIILSIAGLAMTITSFVFIKKLRENRAQKTLFHLALALLLSWVTFLAGFRRVESPGVCLAVAALLHYLILASFLWMLMEGLLQVFMFVIVLKRHVSSYVLKTALVAWGLPCVPVVVILVMDKEMYRGFDNHCWMSSRPFYYAFLAPLGLILLLNIFIYILVVTSLCCRQNMHSSGGHSYSLIGFRASVFCFVVLGLSWVFALFVVMDTHWVFKYLFTTTTSLQGFLIFIIFTARDPKVRQFWRETFCGKTCLAQSRNASDRMPVNQPSSGSGDKSNNGYNNPKFQQK